MLYGARVSLLLAPAAALLSVALAFVVALGGVMLGTWYESAAKITIDIFLSLPWLFLLLAVRSLLPLNTSSGASVVITFSLLGLLGWPGPARILMAAVRRQLDQDYMLMAHASGCGAWRLALIHMAPNLLPLAMAQFWTTAPAFLLSEANLALLGLGIAEPMPSWGAMLRELQNLAALPRQPWVAIPLLLLVLVLSLGQASWTGQEDAA